MNTRSPSPADRTHAQSLLDAAAGALLECGGAAERGTWGGVIGPLDGLLALDLTGGTPSLAALVSELRAAVSDLHASQSPADDETLAALADAIVEIQHVLDGAIADLVPEPESAEDAHDIESEAAAPAAEDDEPASHAAVPEPSEPPTLLAEVDAGFETITDVAEAGPADGAPPEDLEGTGSASEVLLQEPGPAESLPAVDELPANEAVAQSLLDDERTVGADARDIEPQAENDTTAGLASAEIESNPDAGGTDQLDEEAAFLAAELADIALAMRELRGGPPAGPTEPGETVEDSAGAQETGHIAPLPATASNQTNKVLSELDVAVRTATTEELVQQQNVFSELLSELTESAESVAPSGAGDLLASSEPAQEPASEPTSEELSAPVVLAPGANTGPEAEAERPAQEASDATGVMAEAAQDVAAAVTLPAESAAPNNFSEPVALTPEQLAALLSEEAEEQTWGSRPLSLPPERAELLQFMVADLRQSAEQIGPILDEILDISVRSDLASNLVELAGLMRKTSEFFGFASLNKLVELLEVVGTRFLDVPDALMPELLIRCRGIQSLLDQHAGGLEVSMEMVWPLETFSARVNSLLSGAPLHPALVGWHQNDVERVLELDKVVESFGDPVPDPDSPEWLAANPNFVVAAPPPKPAAQAASSSAAQTDDKAASVPMLRVPEALIDRMFDVVRQMVLSRNRVSTLSRRVRDNRDDTDAAQDLCSYTDELGRLTSELQAAVMETRMQPVSRVFERFKRVIRDVANLADKSIELVIEGENTQADRTVIEGLAEPLGQILRFCASRSIEPPSDREQAGKPRAATIRLSAENQGTHLLIRVSDDGNGIDRTKVERQAEELGFADADGLRAMDDTAVFAMLLRPDFDGGGLESVGVALSNMGARTTIGASAQGGLGISIAIPLELTVVESMMIGVGKQVYAVPVQSVSTIVRVDQVSLHSITGRNVLRIRDDVLPAIDLRQSLGEPVTDPSACFAVVVSAGGQTGALLADRIVGRREIVIERMQDSLLEAGPFSGATIGDGGEVSLILDLLKMLKQE